MSFSSDIKNEILLNRLFHTRYKKAHAYGLFLFCRHFSNDGILLSTENEEIAVLFSRFAGSVLGYTPEVQRGEKRSYTCAIDSSEDSSALVSYFEHTTGINTGNLPGREEIGAFLAGVFLSCGSMTDPQKSYRLEFVTRSSQHCESLAEVLEQNIPGVKTTTRRGLYVAYYKECAQIEDMLTLIGASKSSLAMIDVEMIKEVRNRANRVTNCETANIDKTVGAAAGQIEDIRLVFAERGANFLPEGLRKAAELRLDNPELSLRELAEMMDEPISRSGMHHRLEKIASIAQEIREELSGG